MNTENNKKILNRFPDLFPSNFYLGIGDGWFNIFNDLCEDLKPIVKNLNPPFTFIQVKEKFGGLRVYTNYDGDDKVNPVICLAEKKALETCDMCGEKGLLRNSGWLKIRCDNHVDTKHYL